MPHIDVAYILPEPIDVHGTSGAASHVRNVVQQLRTRGCDVRLIGGSTPDGPADDGQHQPEAKPAATSSRERVRRYAPHWLMQTVRNSRKRIKRDATVYRQARDISRADVIYERDAFHAFAGSRLAQFYNIPHVLECNGFFWDGLSNFNEPVLRKQYIRKHVAKWRRADRLIVISEAFKERLCSYEVDASKVSVIHNAVSLEGHDGMTTSDRARILTSHGMKDVLTIGFLGHMLPKHRVNWLCNVTVDLLNKGNNVQMLCVGGGDWKMHRDYVKEKYADVAEYIVFTGPVSPDEVPAYISAMDICTLPGSGSFDSPVKLFDYGGGGKCVVAVDLPSVAEIISDGTNGLLFKATSKQALYAQVAAALDDERLRQRLGEQLREDVEKNHTWAEVGKKTSGIVKSVV